MLSAKHNWTPQTPRGPKGEKRPADAIGNAVMIGRIATGEIVRAAHIIFTASARAIATAMPMIH
jgi:hypothetical protein